MVQNEHKSLDNWYSQNLVVFYDYLMDVQYYKRLLISIAGIYSVYLSFGLIQEKMYTFSLPSSVATAMLVQMELISSTHQHYYLSNVRLTIFLLFYV